MLAMVVVAAEGALAAKTGTADDVLAFVDVVMFLASWNSDVDVWVTVAGCFAELAAEPGKVEEEPGCVAAGREGSGFAC